MSTKNRFSTTLLRISRLASYLAVVAACLTGAGTKIVHAKSTNAAMELGESLGELDVAPGEAAQLEINGQRLQLASARVDGTVHEVLTRLEGACRSHADGLADDLAHLDGLMTRPASEQGFPGVGILRDERDDRGVVVCFAAGETVPARALVSRVRAFLKSHDLADVGAVRYVTARADRDGKTRVTATWTNERLPLDAMFPPEGDAGGGNPSAAPRPRDARRVLSARVGASRYGAFVYETAEGVNAALGRYEADLVRERHFEVVEGGVRSKNGRAYRRGLVDVLVTATPTANGTAISVIESQYAQATTARGEGGGR